MIFLMIFPERGAIAASRNGGVMSSMHIIGLNKKYAYIFKMMVARYRILLPSC